MSGDLAVSLYDEIRRSPKGHLTKIITTFLYLSWRSYQIGTPAINITPEDF